MDGWISVDPFTSREYPQHKPGTPGHFPLYFFRSNFALDFLTLLPFPFRWFLTALRGNLGTAIMEPHADLNKAPPPLSRSTDRGMDIRRNESNHGPYNVTLDGQLYQIPVYNGDLFHSPLLRRGFGWYQATHCVDH